MKNSSIYTLRLVREKEVAYNPGKTDTPEKAVEAAEALFSLSTEPAEVFVLIALNVKNDIIGAFEVGRGMLSGCYAGPREIMQKALAVNAASIILAHNHPSGNPAPTQTDIDTTVRIKDAGEMLGISVLDHVIIGAGKARWASMRQDNLAGW